MSHRRFPIDRRCFNARLLTYRLLKKGGEVGGGGGDCDSIVITERCTGLLDRSSVLMVYLARAAGLSIEPCHCESVTR